MGLKDRINRLLRSWVGYEIVAYNLQRQHVIRKRKLLTDLRVATVLDVGANRGQFARQLREEGYAGTILSFEPNPESFKVLAERMADDPNWRGFNVAIGECDGEAVLNVTDISEVCSLLPATGAATTAAWRTGRAVTVSKRSLDSLLPELLDPTAGAAYLKLDIQGYEAAALDGAIQSLKRFVAIEMEMSTIPLYEGESLFPSLVVRMAEAGFELFSLDTVLVDYNKGRVLQVEGLFVSRGAVPY